MRLKDWFKKHGSTVLTGLGVGGVVGTAACAVYDAKHCKEECPKSFLGKVKYGFKHYYRTILCGSGTVGFILGAHGMSKATERSLVATIASLEGLHNGYRQTAKDILGPNTDEFIEECRKRERKDMDDGLPPWDVKQTFYLDLPEELVKEPVFFERTMYEVLKSEYDYNRRLATMYTTTINDLLECFGLPRIEDDKNMGHDQYLGEIDYGYRWIDFCHKQVHNDDDMLIWAIEMPFGLHDLSEKWID